MSPADAHASYSPLTDKRASASLKTMLWISLGIHLAAVGAAFVSELMGHHRQQQVENAIQTRLVKLGQDKPQWLPRLPNTPPPPKEEAVAISTDAKAIPTPRKSPTPKDEKKAFDDAMKRLNNWEKKDVTDDFKGKGDVRGSKIGTVSDFTLQTLGMQYATDIDGRIRPNWTIPSVIAEEERAALKASIVLYIAPDGKVLKIEFESHSTNGLFDDALLKAIRLSSPLPAPPGELRERVMRDGFEITFSGKR